MQSQQQEELAGLFSRTMNISNPTPPPDTHYQPPPTAQSTPTTFQQPKVYASTHYTPTHHVVPVRFGVSYPSTPEPRQPLSDPELWAMLVQNGIDPHTLFPSQVHLVRHADPEQRLRILELWRISPPNLGAYDLAKEQQSWLETDLQKEEEMARLRYERMMAERTLGRGNSGTNLATQQTPENIVEVEHPERPASAPESRSSAEPYILSCYEMLSKREYDESISPLRESTRYNQATDPVFRGAEPWQQKSGPEELENRPGGFVMEDQEMEL